MTIQNAAVVVAVVDDVEPLARCDLAVVVDEDFGAAGTVIPTRVLPTDGAN